MKKKRFKRDFDYWIDEYMYNCRSRKLRPKTMISYEQTLRLFERCCLEEANITAPEQVRNERKAQEYLEDHEIEKLLKIFDRSYFPEHRDFMVIMLILDTGIRLGECLQVTTDDLDMDDRSIPIS